MNNTPIEISDKIAEISYANIGDTFRLKHLYNEYTGQVCTPESKGEALVLKKKIEGWSWTCYRCGQWGYVDDEKYLTPEQTKNKLKAVNDKSEIVEKVKLPDDFTADIPFEGIKWLRQYYMTNELIALNNIGWSDQYQRVIIPIYDDGKHNAWIGRNVYDDKRPKYITKKNGKDRCYYTKVGKNHDTWIFVEDCLSAIRVNNSLDITTIALLTSNIGNDMISCCKGFSVYFWLDPDMMAKSFKTVSRFRALGINANSICTQNDPKTYHDDTIRQIWENQHES